MTAEPLTVGVTGHRPARLVGVDTAVLAAQICATLEAFADAAGHDRKFRLVSSLAEGADSIAAGVALQMGWQLDVTLPFDRVRNAQDFPDSDALAALDALLLRADSVFELCSGCLEAEPASTAYERAGRVMLAQCDVLLAVWDGKPAQGRGGAAQIVAEAVLQGVPVLHVALADGARPLLLWDRLDEHDVGQHTLDTIPRAGLEQLPRLVAHLLGDADSGALPRHYRGRRRLTVAVAYAMLMAVMAVRSLRGADFVKADPDIARDALLAGCSATRQATPFGERLTRVLAPGFGSADASATDFSRRFRSAYVANFVLAALAVVTALVGLALPKSAKPGLIVIELAIVATILIVTRMGNKSGWHRSWLSSRQVAEQLRCLAITAQLGDLRLRANTHPTTRNVARQLGLPNAIADAPYLAAIQADLGRLIDSQIDYLERDASVMHRLEHRLHRLGGLLFLATATICLLYLAAEVAIMANPAWHHIVEPVLIWGTILSAGFPAIGAAIYGIRMQGDFSGSGERNAALAAELRRVRQLTQKTPQTYDTLARHAKIVADLMVADLTDWFRAYKARPLALPG